MTKAKMYYDLLKEERSRLRGIIFKHLDGFSISASSLALKDGGVLTLLEEKKTINLKEICAATNGNEGYLNVALRILCSQGWLIQNIIDNDQIEFTLTEKGRVAFQFVDLYREVVSFIPVLVDFEKHLFGNFNKEDAENLKSILNQQKQNWGLEKSNDELTNVVQNEILTHIEGLIVGSFLVALGMNGFFKEYGQSNPTFDVAELNGDVDSLNEIFTFLAEKGWFEKEGTTVNFTAKGLFFAKRASAYGVTVSYLPTFNSVKELLYGNPKIFWERPPTSPEIHVNRTMNVWGSGGAHAGYFKKIDEIVIDLFNRPIEEQPKGFADMGSGNGAFLEHLFDVIWTKTIRGKMLKEHPLFIVGSDFNEAALVSTHQTLKEGDIWGEVVWGDIGDPDQLAEKLKEKYNINLSELLNVRSFLDHNRIYNRPNGEVQILEPHSTGAFCFRGERLSNDRVTQSLIEHFKKWTPYVKKFGLLVIELHTIPPTLAAANIGKTAVTAYDGTHGYSDQYIVEYEVFLKAAEAAGLSLDPNHQAKYPPSELATVSINLLRSLD
jgi:hypothetical protein